MDIYKKTLALIISLVITTSAFTACQAEETIETAINISEVTTISDKPEVITTTEKTEAIITTVIQMTEAVTEYNPLNFNYEDEVVPDYVSEAKALIDSDCDYFYIGMVDLKNPGGYRYIDDVNVHPGCVIKVFVMEYVYLQIADGKADLNDDVFGISLKDRIDSMIHISSNENADAILKYFGRRNIDKWLAQNYVNTRLYSDFCGNEHDGKYNTLNIVDAITFLEKLYNNKNDEPYKAMYETMLGTQTREKIPESLIDIPNISVANKTGSFSSDGYTTDNDIAIVIDYDENGDIKTAYAIAIFTRASQVNYFFAARPSIIAVSRDVFERISNTDRYKYN